MKDKFTGSDGERRLIEALLEQPTIQNDENIARRVIASSELEEFPSGHTLLAQGAHDDDIFFLLIGRVNIIVNGRRVATRNAGQPIGEMTLLSPTSERSATVVTTEPSLVLKTNESDFRKIADEHPTIWRSLANLVATRLREREKFHHVPNETPTLFIGSSVEGLAVANAIVRGLKHAPLSPRLWTTPGLFSAGSTTIDTLLDEVGRADFAAFVFGPDDKIASREDAYHVPRDNVIFELGLFMGQLHRKRAYIVLEHRSDVKIPTDLLGLTPITYVTKPGEDMNTCMSAVCSELTALASELGPK